MNYLLSAGGADGAAVELGGNSASPRATEEGVGEQWFLMAVSAPA